MKYSFHPTNFSNQNFIDSFHHTQYRIITSKYYLSQLYVYQIQPISNYLNLLLKKNKYNHNQNNKITQKHYQIHYHNKLNSSFMLPVQFKRKLNFQQTVNANQPIQYLSQYHDMNHIKAIITFSVHQRLKKDTFYPLSIYHIQFKQQFKLHCKNNIKIKNSLKDKNLDKKLKTKLNYQFNHNQISSNQSQSLQNISKIQSNCIQIEYLNQKSLLQEVLQDLAYNQQKTNSFILGGNLDYFDLNCKQFILQQQNQQYKEDPYSKASTENTNLQAMQSQQLYGLTKFKPKFKKQMNVNYFTENKNSISNLRDLKKQNMKMRNSQSKELQITRIQMTKKIVQRIKSKDKILKSNQKSAKKSIDSKMHKKKLNCSKSKKSLKLQH